MRQRLALARALCGAHRCSCWTSPQRSRPHRYRGVPRVVKQVAATGATVLISSHILAEVEKFVHRVLAIDKGELRFDGTLSQLLAQAGGATVRYVVRAQDGAALIAALQALGYQPVATGDNGATLDVPQAEADELLLKLAQAGVRVSSAAPTADNLGGPTCASWA